MVQSNHDEAPLVDEVRKSGRREREHRGGYAYSSIGRGSGRASERKSGGYSSVNDHYHSYEHLVSAIEEGVSRMPPDVYRLQEMGLDLTSRYHIAIPISYFFVGFLNSFVSNPLNIFTVQSLNAQPYEQNTLMVLMTIPWSFKLVYGFISDVFPVGGLRRKPYLIAGYLMSSACFMTLALTPQVEMRALSGLLFLATMGQIMGDVMADTLVVERAKAEPEEAKGRMQASCYSIRFVGNVVGSTGGALLYNRERWGWGLTFSQVCLITSILPAIALGPALIFLWEGRTKSPKSIRNQVRDIWDTIQLKAVWRPLAFVYTFNIFQVRNIAWQSYLQLSLHFEPYMLGVIAAAGSIMTCIGVLAYKTYFFNVSWRLIYAWSVGVTVVFSALQLVLIFGLNRQFGLPDFWFALGDDVITEYIQGIQFLPVVIMYLRLCPDGSEGATYAALTTFSNIALTCGGSIGTVLGKIWDVSNEALRHNDVSGLWKLALLTSSLSPLPLVLLHLLPAGPAEQEALRSDKKRSVWGGAAFLVVLSGSLLWTLIEACIVLLEDAGAEN